MASNTEGNTDVALEASMCGIAGLTLVHDFVSREEEQVLARIGDHTAFCCKIAPALSSVHCKDLMSLCQADAAVSH